MRKICKKLYASAIDKRLISLGFIGFACGLPLFLTASTLTLWLNQVGVSYTNIGLISLVALPYSMKSLWAPFIEYLHIPYLTKKLGQKRSWLLTSQIILILSILVISQTDPATNLLLTIIAAVFIASAAATQEIVMLTYQAHSLKYKQYGPGESFSILGYRIGLLISGSGALYLAEYFTWSEVYQLMACISLIGIITTFVIAEPKFAKKDQSNSQDIKISKQYKQLNQIAQNCYKNIIYPFLDFLKHKHCYLIIMIMITYKLGDNLIGNMSNIFFSEVGFSKIEIANASKIFGMVATISGGVIAGFLMNKIGKIRLLIITIIVHGFSILLLILIAKTGYNILMLYLTIAIEHITGGMRTTALLVLQLSLINKNYAGTQLALLNSFTHFSRTFFSSLSGLLIDHLGWILFFMLCSSSTIISLAFVVYFAVINKKQKITI